ncbi:MAG: hypothetical protein R3B71_00385 [Candidatus Gracilibacteria bacterium]
MDQQPVENTPVVEQEESYGPRPMSFFTMVLKTFAGFGGGIAGTIVLIVIFLATSSILQPALGGAAMSPDEVSPLFIVVLLGMVFATSLVSSMVGPLFLAYTERERYTRISTTLGQIFIMNIVIFAFVLPVYLTASSTSLQITAFTAALQVILSATAGSLILELLHDARYPLLAVYETVLALLTSIAIGFLFFTITNNATILMFIALPMIWGFIGFFHAAVTMFYYWIFTTFGTDYLATESQFGTDYGIPEESEEVEEDEQVEDVEGSDFLNQ